VIESMAGKISTINYTDFLHSIALAIRYFLHSELSKN